MSQPIDDDGFPYEYDLFDDVAYATEDQQARQEWGDYLRETGRLAQ